MSIRYIPIKVYCLQLCRSMNMNLVPPFWIYTQARIQTTRPQLLFFCEIYLLLRASGVAGLHTPPPPPPPPIFFLPTIVITKRSEAYNCDIRAQNLSYRLYIYIYIYIFVRPLPQGGPRQRHVFKMVSLAVTWMPSSNL